MKLLNGFYQVTKIFGLFVVKIGKLYFMEKPLVLIAALYEMMILSTPAETKIQSSLFFSFSPRYKY